MHQPTTKDKVILMAWIFLPGGLLMPAAVPMDKVDAHWTNDGEYNLQVRARTLSHLTNFIRDYMTEGTYSEIQSTPEMDYNFRFYTSKVTFATAIAQAMLDIDYKKFKPTAEDRYEDGTLKYKDGKEYHSVLNSIWGTVCRLGSPGGKWAKWLTSDTATAGRRYTPWGEGVSKYADSATTVGTRYSEGFGRPEDAADDLWMSAYDRAKGWDDSTKEDAEPSDDAIFEARAEHAGIFGSQWLEDDDYVPASQERKEILLDIVAHLPASQWDTWLTWEEMALVAVEHESAARYERMQNRDERKKNRKRSRRASRQPQRRSARVR